MSFSKRPHLFNSQNIILLVLIVVSLLAAFIPYFKIDLLISEKIQSIDSRFFSNLMWLDSSIGNFPIMMFIVGFTGVLLFAFKLRTEAVISTLAAAGSSLSGSLLKVLINRPRPESGLVDVSTWLSDKSYPSNHALVFTVFFGFMLYLLVKKSNHKKTTLLPIILLILLISTIGISRIYLGVHWASDVLGGYLLGVLWLIFTIRIYNSYNGKR